MSEQLESKPPVSAELYAHWLRKTLSGKRVDPTQGEQECRVIFLLEDAPDACHRTDVLMTRQGIEVRNGRFGGEALPEVTISAATEDWVSYLEAPGPETLQPIHIYGNPFLYETLNKLLTQRTSMVALRASAAPSSAPTRRLKRRRKK